MSATPSQSGNADDPSTGTFSREQLQLPPSGRSEVEWLHSAEECPLVLQRRHKTSRSIDRKKELLALWIKLGRPHPVILRHGIPLEGSGGRELRELCEWSWEMANEFENGNESVGSTPLVPSRVPDTRAQERFRGASHRRIADAREPWPRRSLSRLRKRLALRMLLIHLRRQADLLALQSKRTPVLSRILERFVVALGLLIFGPRKLLRSSAQTPFPSIEAMRDTLLPLARRTPQDSRVQ